MLVYNLLLQAAIDVILSAEETYADIVPIRLNPKSPSAYVSVCSFVILQVLVYSISNVCFYLAP